MIHSGGPARRPQSGAPTVRLVHGGVQYREYLRKEQRSQRPGPPPRVFQRGGVERGCIAGRMQLEFHHGLRAFVWTAAVTIIGVAFRQNRSSSSTYPK